MSGHSKWSTIKRKKAATDAKRGQLFTKLLKEIQVAASSGGGSPDSNFRLKAAISAAKSGSVPLDNIERAIKRGLGEGDGEQYEEITYEGYGPGGIALLIRTFTDNRNRTVAEIRHSLVRSGGTLASSNSVAYLFQEKGVVKVPKELASFDEVFENALEAGADEVEDGDKFWIVLCSAQEFESVRVALETLGEGVEANFLPLAINQVLVEGEDAESLFKLLDALDDLDDVQSVIGNFTFASDD
jgi:YebC/PmpR family DNA-binding regulatory protein